MAKKKHISDDKKVSILSYGMRQLSVRGKYFKIKVDDPSHYISNLRALPVQNYAELLDTFEKLQPSPHLLSLPKKRIKDVLSSFLSFIDFDSEFFWAKNIIIRNCNTINDFIKLSDRYSHLILYGNYNDAFLILDEIQRKYGYSIWLVKNRISLYQLSGGLEEQKKYTQKIKKELKNGSLAKFLFHWISVRNEDQTSVGRFKNQVEQIINKLDSEKQIGAISFLKYHLIDNEISDIEELSHVLRLSHSASIIDYYEAYVSLLKIMLLDKDEKTVSKAINFIINQNVIIDSRLTILATLIKKSESAECQDNNANEIYCELLKGNFDLVIKTVENELIKGHSITANIMIYAYAKAFLENNVDDTENNEEQPNTLISKIIFDLSRVLRSGIINASKEFNELNKIALNFSHFPWSSSIKLLLCKENSLLLNQSPGCIVSVFNATNVHPIFIEYIDHTATGLAYEKICESLYINKLSTKFQKSLKYLKRNETPELMPIFGNYVDGLIYFNDKDFNNSIHCGKLLSDADQRFFVRRGFGLIAHSYVKDNRIKEACESVSSCYLAEKNFYPFLPVQELVGILSTNPSIWKEVNSTVDLSIILDVFVKHYDKSSERLRRFAYEDFLIKIGIERPSHLRPLITKVDLNKIVYYLRYICLENTMDTSGAFEGGSSEVVQERLEICRLLTEIDPSNEKVYMQEIKEIVRRQVITRRRQEVDQSRIYVDIKSIKEWAEIELEESFYRYISFLKSGLANNFSRAPHVEQKTVSAIDTPDDEVHELLRFMIEDIRSSYLSADIGLDRFISTRIRHGELERTMRIPIQKHELITKKRLKTGPYSSNEYWLSKLEGAPESIEIAESAFISFSEKYDSLISKIANEWLQIKSSDKPQGLFEFSFVNSDIQRIADLIDVNTTLPEFVDLVIRYLESTLILILVNIREVLNTKGKNEAKKIVNKLNTDILEVANLHSLEFQRSISQARTDLAAQFDKIIEWFIPSTEGNSSPYTIEDAILVAEAIIKEAVPNFKVNISSIGDTDYSIHGQLPIFIDIFNNIFDNVIKRSGLDSPEADILFSYVDVTDAGFRLNVKISNFLGDDIDKDQVLLTLEEIRNKLNQGSYSQYVAKDRNSGLFKIHKSVSDFTVIDSDEKPEMNFGLIEDQFHVEFSVPFKIFKLLEEQATEII